MKRFMHIFPFIGSTLQFYWWNHLDSTITIKNAKISAHINIVCLLFHIFASSQKTVADIIGNIQLLFARSSCLPYLSNK